MGNADARHFAAGRLVVSLIVFVVALVLGARGLAQVPGGGGDTATDCFSEFQGVSSETVTCADGDLSCDADGAADGKCTFNVSLCLNQTNVPGCTPTPLKKVRATGMPKGVKLQIPTDLTNPNCGSPTAVVVKLGGRGKNKGKKPRTEKIKVTAKSTSKQKDKDVLSLTCTPSGGGGGGLKQCPANSAGADQPNQVLMTVKDAGTDLDNGWKGPSHNFPTPAGTQLLLCLDHCDKTTDSKCDTTILTGEGTFNRTTFGPPLPLFAAGVPVCVVNEFRPEQATAVGTADIATGEITGNVFLSSHVFLTEEEKVCPKCVNSKCDSGPKQGASCHVDGTVTVVESSAANKTFTLSKDCPPPNTSPAGTLTINLPVTTGTSMLAPLPGGNAQTPCVAQAGEPRGIAPAPDQCGGGSCTAKCAGDACANPNGVDPVTGETVCIDAKGGISQLCCSSDPTRPCYPTAAGNPIGEIKRVGKPSVPMPPWATDQTYPKTSEPVVVATFCEPATGTGSVDGLTGLPGPGALILPNTAEWMVKPPTP